MKEFDTAKGAFWLVAIIIGTQMIVTIIVVVACTIGKLYTSLEDCKDISQPLMELFQMSFTAAIAFAGGRMSAPTAPHPTLPKDDVK